MGSIRLLLHKRSRTDIVFTAKMWHEMLWCLLGRARVSRPPTQLSDGLRRCLMHWTRALRRQLLTFRLMVYIPLGTANDKNLENCWPTCSLDVMKTRSKLVPSKLTASSVLCKISISGAVFQSQDANIRAWSTVAHQSEEMTLKSKINWREDERAKRHHATEDLGHMMRD